MTDCGQFFSRWGHLIADEDDELRALRKLQLYLHPDKHHGEEEKYTQEFKQLNDCKNKISSYTRAPIRAPSPIRQQSPQRRQQSPQRRQQIPRAVYEEIDRQLAELEIQRRDERIRQRRVEKARQEAIELAERERLQKEREAMQKRKESLADQIERERQLAAAERRSQRLRDEEEERLYQKRRAEREKWFKEEDDDIPTVNDLWREELAAREREIREQKKREIREQKKREIIEQQKAQASRKSPSWCGRFCSMGQEYKYEGTKMNRVRKY